MTEIYLETICSTQAGIAGPVSNLVLEKESLNKKEIGLNAYDNINGRISRKDKTHIIALQIFGIFYIMLGT